MVEEDRENYVLRAKTGWTRDGGKDTGWWTGYLETNGNVYFFATRLIKDRNTINSNFANCRKDFTKVLIESADRREILRNFRTEPELMPAVIDVEVVEK